MNTSVRFYLSYDIKVTLKYHFCLKIYYFVIMYATLLWTSQLFPKICKPLVVYPFYCKVLYHSQTRCHVIMLVPVLAVYVAPFKSLTCNKPCWMIYIPILCYRFSANKTLIYRIFELISWLLKLFNPFHSDEFSQ